jgi:AraC-like DNA-binding protein
VQCRMDRARILLQETASSIGQISDELGYQDVGYFSRQFKQRTGRSPLDFRRLGDVRNSI